VILRNPRPGASRFEPLSQRPSQRRFCHQRPTAATARPMMSSMLLWVWKLCQARPMPADVRDSDQPTWYITPAMLSTQESFVSRRMGNVVEARLGTQYDAGIVRGPDPRKLITEDLQGAGAAAFEIQKERELNGYRLYAVDWRSAKGEAYAGVFTALLQDDGEWLVSQAHWGRETGFERGRPWVNLGCGGSPLYFGGRVCEAPAATRVTITHEQRTFEGDVDGTGWVLFPTDQPNVADLGAWVVEILGANGAIMARHRAGGRAEPL
jgi:hypothetical protein